MPSPKFVFVPSASASSSPFIAILHIMAPPKPNKPAMDPDVPKYLLSTAQSTVPLQISTSSMEGAGFGLFVTKAVADATEVFRIERPLVTAVDPDQLPTTCDYCVLSVKYQEDIFVEIQPALLRCGRCRTVYYCSKVSKRLPSCTSVLHPCTVVRVLDPANENRNARRLLGSLTTSWSVYPPHLDWRPWIRFTDC